MSRAGPWKSARQRSVRFAAIDRAIYWFDVDQAERKVRFLAEFFGGQDHVRRMLLRLLRQDENI